MKENLKIAYELLRSGKAEAEAVTRAMEEVKNLPRREDQVFDMTGISANIYEAAGVVYPFYMYYETKVNGKKGYFDLMEQLRCLTGRIEQEYTLEYVSAYLHMMICTIEAISPEIYELYRELADTFKAQMKKALSVFAEAESCEAKASIGRSLAKACSMDLMLAEKYLEKAESFQA